MGMTGNYVLLPEEMIQQIAEKKLDFFDITPPTEDNMSLDIDKSWQAIHFLLCGDLDDGEPPLGYVVPLIDAQFFDSDFDFGSFYLFHSQIKKAFAKIKEIDKESFRRLYDFPLLLEESIYPLTPEESEEEFFQYLYQNFEAIKGLYHQALETNSGLIFYIS